MTNQQLHVESLETRRLLSGDLTGSFFSRLPAAIPLQAVNRVTVRISNQGDALAKGPVTVQLFASSDTTLDSSDIALGMAATANLKLKPGKFADVPLKFLSPTTVSTGSYYLLAQIVPGGAIGDVNTADKVFASTAAVKITAPFVDLTDTVLLSPKTVSYTVGAKKQVPIRFTVVVVNAGNVPVKGPLAINIFGSNNSTLDAQDSLLLSLPTRMIGIKAGKTKTYAVTFKPTAATQSGTFFAIAQLVPGAGIVESSTSNDAAVTGNQVTISNAALPAVPKLVGGLSDDVVEVLVGTTESVIFTATVANETTTTEVEIDEVDASGSPISKIADLYDTGNIADGDVTAGDGIFTGIVPISFGSPVTRYFVATLTDPGTVTTQHSTAVSITGIVAPTPGSR